MMPPALPKIFLFATCDRLNFGDLLFPIVTGAALRKLNSKVQLECFGVAARDLSAWGALPNGGLSDMYERADSQTVIAVAGGELLAQRWLATHLSLVDAEGAAALLRREGEVGREEADILSREALGGRAPLPFALRSKDFRGWPKIIYNSVGSWPIVSLTVREKVSLIEGLQDASYVSIRDTESLCLVQGLLPSLSAGYAPDCVFLLSDLFSRDDLAARSRREMTRFAEDPLPYFCFQCNSDFGRGHRSTIASELNTIVEATGWRILLLPIGRITGYDDESGLREIANEVKGTVWLPSNATLWETSFCLASARSFAGTSLHGVVSAISYDVPAIALQTNDRKLANNIRSWQLPSPNRTVPIEELSGSILASPASSSKDQLLGRKRLQTEAWKSIASLLRHSTW